MKPLMKRVPNKRMTQEIKVNQEYLNEKFFHNVFQFYHEIGTVFMEIRKRGNKITN